MSPRDPQVVDYLAGLKRERRSSPEGIAWQRFFERLCTLKRPDADAPPVPLIFAASNESNSAKHRRLVAQLEWAGENGCLEEALRALRSIPSAQWSTGSLQRWDEDTY